MRIYRHKQMGTLTLVFLGFGVALAAFATIVTPSSPALPRIVAGSVLIILLLSMLLFHALTVELTAQELIVSFGPGLIRKRFRIEDICNVRIVRNPWYYGWGIRLTPHGWLFNVSGLDAVELELKGSRKFRIGTDEPQRLIAAIGTVCRLTGRSN